MRTRILPWLLCAALTFSAAFAQQPAAVNGDASPPSITAVVTALKSGGYIVYFRHAATDFSQNDEKMRDFDDCANQRNLIDSGRDQARSIGAAWKRLGIPVGAVVASPYCRTRETARLAFGRVQAAPEARGGPGTAADAARYQPLSERLATRPKAGVNDVIVSHGNPFRALHPELGYLAEAEAAIIKPLGSGSHEVWARVPWDQWPQ